MITISKRVCLLLENGDTFSGPGTTSEGSEWSDHTAIAVASISQAISLKRIADVVVGAERALRSPKGQQVMLHLIQAITEES